MPPRRNNPNNSFVSKAQNRGQVQVEPMPGDTGPGIVDQTKPSGQFNDRMRLDEYGAVNKNTMRPKQPINRV